MLGRLLLWLFLKFVLEFKEVEYKLECFEFKGVFFVEECLSLNIFFFMWVCFILFCKIEVCFFNFKIVIFNSVILVKSFWVCIM